MENIPTISQEIEREAHVSTEMENINIASQDIEVEDVPSIKIYELQHDPSTTYTRGMLESLSPLSSECCIYKVPNRLREVNAKAYTPQIVSIGPFHHGEKSLQAMEEHKLRYLQTFLKWTEQSLEDCVEVVRRWEERARNCYAETIELSSDAFVKMILVDGSFIVVLLLRYYFPKLRDEIDRIFYKPWMHDDVREDLMLLENQVPFFILEGFFTLVPNSNLNGNVSFLDLTYQYFNPLQKINKHPDKIYNPNIGHFVDFIRHSCVPSFSKLMPKGTAVYDFSPSVTKLREAGIKFKRGTSCSLLDIKFTNGILEVPHLMINNTTETSFRNIIAFEQCHCINRYITDYMTLIVGMINSSKDVDLLIQHGIITSRLASSEDVSVLFNNIGKEVFLDDKFYFSPLCDKLNEYCKAPWHKWKATLKHDYSKTPWPAVSTFYAVAILILTVIQAVCSVKSM